MNHRNLPQRWVLFGIALALSLLAFSGQAQEHTGKRLALVIGNDAYQHISRLNNARNDARLMTATLKKAGFDVTQVNDLARTVMWTTIDTFKGRIQKGDEVVFYYAGHGAQINSNQLLLPIDIEAHSDSQVQRDGVSLVEVQDALKDARFALLVIDACRNNPFPKTGTRAIGGGVRGLIPPEPVTGQVMMMSAGRNQTALDSVPGESQANGLFTWELTQIMQNPGVEIRVALERVKDRVDDKARKAGHEQRPSLVNDLRGNFYFFGPTTVQVQGSPVIDPEVETWAAAESAKSTMGYQVYLEGYPKGRYALAAKIKLDALKPTSVQPVTSAVPIVKPLTQGEDEAVAQYYKAAIQGDAAAQTELGFRFANGRGVAKDEAQGVAWYRKAAVQSNARAQYNLGVMLAGGQGVAKDDAQAVDWYRKAAAQGYTAAQYGLGFMLANGRGAIKDEAQAVAWYYKAAVEGDINAQFSLGVMLERGQGVAKNEAQAVAWYRKAADRGYANAQYNLGVMLANGQGAAKDEVQGVAWYRKAADQGYANAQFNLGVMLERGQGVAKDEAQAVAWYRKAADQGYVNAQYNLGVMLANGQGVAKDEAQGVAWYRKAAVQGYHFAQFNLGVMLASGRGVAQDDEQAVAWYRKAAAQGYVNAQAELRRRGL